MLVSGRRLLMSGRIMSSGRTIFITLLLTAALSACGRTERERAVAAPIREPAPPEVTQAVTEPPTQLAALSADPVASDMHLPAGYQGPIDPEWPPSHPADLEIELKAARILRRTLKRGARPPRESLLEGDAPGVFAEEGRIGGFDYIEVVLGHEAHPDEEMPLVILLHGRGGRPRIPQGPVPADLALRLFIPRGPDPLQGGFNWLATWTNSGKLELLSRSLAGRVDQLMPAIEAFSRLRPTRGKPIVAGFSQGGILSFALATRYPEQFSAAIPIAGWLPPGMLPTEKKAGASYPLIHAFHGQKDMTVPTEKGRMTVEALRSIGIAVEYTEVPGVGHDVSPEINQQVRREIALLVEEH